VADEGSRNRVATGRVTDDTPVTSGPKEPGWYPSRLSPNDQSYWDGTAWIARRHWSQGAWVTSGEAPETAEPALISANPFATSASETMRASGRQRRFAKAESSLSLGLLLLLASGVLLMVGSTMTWLHGDAAFGHFFHVNISLKGLDPGISALLSINGYATFVCGVVIVALTGAAMAADDAQLRKLTLVVALTSLAFSIYFVVGVVQKINDVSGHGNATVGPGLFVLIIGGVLAGIAAFGRLVQNL
jgi:hypothetical protein